jgi:RHS repeat-associated protein
LIETETNLTVLSTEFPGSEGSYASYGYYRYGFNGKENDNEVKGEGYQQDYGMRIYDPRLGRFLSTDPLTSGQPFYSPYIFTGNKPILAIDKNGEVEVIVYHVIYDKTWKTILR